MSMIRKCDKHAKATECEGELSTYLLAVITCDDNGMVETTGAEGIDAASMGSVIEGVVFESLRVDVCPPGLVALKKDIFEAIHKPVRRKRGEVTPK